MISLLIVAYCPDLRDVKLGSSKCGCAKWLMKVFDIWDGGQNCLPGCLEEMNKKKLEKGYCEATKLSEGNKKTICNFCYTIDVVEPCSANKKIVECKGTLKCFQYRMLIIRFFSLIGLNTFVIY